MESSIVEIRSEGESESLRVFFPYANEIKRSGRREVFNPEGLKPQSPLLLLKEHDFKLPLASTAAGLSIEFQDKGVELLSPIDSMPKTPNVTATLEEIRSGVISSVSPRFVAQRNSFRGGTRIIHQAILREVSVTADPAYVDGMAELRSDSWIDETRSEKGLHIPRRQWWL